MTAILDDVNTYINNYFENLFNKSLYDFLIDTINDKNYIIQQKILKLKTLLLMMTIIMTMKKKNQKNIKMKYVKQYIRIYVQMMIYRNKNRIIDNIINVAKRQFIIIMELNEKENEKK